MLNPVGKTLVTDPLFKYSANFLSHNNGFFIVKFNYTNQLHNLCVLPNFFSIVKLMLLALLNQLIFLVSS